MTVAALYWPDELIPMHLPHRETVMKKLHFRARPGLLLGATALSLLMFGAQAAEARDRPGHAPRGDYTRHTERQKTENGRTRSDTWTNSAGKTATRDAVVVNDRESGTRTRDVQWQGPNGGQASRHDVTQKTADGYTRSSVATNRKGQTATREAEVVRDKEAGTRTREVTTTGFNGKTRTVDDVTQKTDDGYTRNTTVTHANGATSTRDVTATYDPVTKTWVKDVTVDRHRDGG